MSGMMWATASRARDHRLPLLALLLLLPAIPTVLRTSCSTADAAPSHGSNSIPKPQPDANAKSAADVTPSSRRRSVSPSNTDLGSELDKLPAKAKTWTFKDTPTPHRLQPGQLALFLIWMACIVRFTMLKLQEGNGSSMSTPTSKNDKAGPPLRPEITETRALYNLTLLGLIMFYYWLLDDQQIFPPMKKTYNRDQFYLILGAILAFSSQFVKNVSEPGTGKYLNRDQTEEWKGWMQIVFVLYHYFAAKEVYNLIRLLIAAYVWMTGFGNFSFFWIKKDYSIFRLLKMFFRLNFLVCFICIVMHKEVVLYYICPMHTLWFLSVWLMMYIGNEHNGNPYFMATKFAAYFAVCFLIYDVEGMAEFVYSPFRWLLDLDGSLHEWIFRTHLDHYACFFGMLCAYFHPWVEVQLAKWDEQGLSARLPVAGVLLLGLYWFITNIFVLPKFEYNAMHPYFSWLPILVYIILRNLTPALRDSSLSKFSWSGRITLETYLSQFHIWMMRSDEKEVAGLVNFFGIGDDYPYWNWVLASIIYVYVSYVLFHITVELNVFCFKNNDLVAASKKVGIPIISWIVLKYLIMGMGLHTHV